MPMFSTISRHLDLGRFFGRIRQEVGPITLDRRRVYILPTRAGVVFAAILLAMLVGSINYANSLGFALTFLLGSLTLVSILHTFRNLHGLTFRPGHPRPVFVGEEAVFPLAIQNARPLARLGLNLAMARQAAEAVDVAPHSTHWVELRVPARRRGRLALPRLNLSTRYPVGLFHAWSYVLPTTECLIYPRPAAQGGLPAELLASAGGGSRDGRGGDDFAGLRRYQAGDSLRHLHWKAVARGLGLLTKEFSGEQVGELWLDWDKATAPGIEARLSLLCRWILEADRQGLAYGLALPGLRLSPDNGTEHRQRCLKALALFGGGS